MSLAAVLAAVLTLAGSPVRAERERDGDRRERRSQELALPDEYLDPSWPDENSYGAAAAAPGAAAPPVVPEESDSVERAPIPDEAADRAEVEEMQRYKEALGLPTGPDDFTHDHWDDAEPAHESHGEKDPPEW